MNRYSGVAMQEAAAVQHGFITRVYAWMCAALAITAITAGVVASMPHLATFAARFFWLFVIAELVLVVALSAAVMKLSTTAAWLMFFAYATLNGLTLSMIFLVYPIGSIAAAFGATAGVYGVTALYGYTTKADLSGLGGFLTMSLIGLVIASVVNIFWANSALYWVVTYVSVFVFVGLTAYDMQKLRQMQRAGLTGENLAICGALRLYLDFVNLFLALLRIFGRGRD